MGSGVFLEKKDQKELLEGFRSVLAILEMEEKIIFIYKVKILSFYQFIYNLFMNSEPFVVFHSAEEKIGPAVEEKINREIINLGKPSIYSEYEEWYDHKMEKICPLIK